MASPKAHARRAVGENSTEPTQIPSGLSGSRGGAESAQPCFPADGTQSSVVWGYHICAGRGAVGLFSRSAGFVCSPGGGVAGLGVTRCVARHAGTLPSCGNPSASEGLTLSFGPRGTISKSAVPTLSQTPAHQPKHESQRQLLGQCPDGTILPQPENRACQVICVSDCDLILCWHSIS